MNLFQDAKRAAGISPRLTFAIGDVHGERELLERAFAAMEDRAGGETWRAVLLGDYVDRGPDSAGVIRLLRAAEREGGIVCLKGNHEAMMIKAIETGDTGHWFRNGGKETLRSYHGAVELEDIAWMRGLPVAFVDEHRVYVHGGLEPGVPLAEQEEETCLWIRVPFLRASAEALPAHVVHGHTPRWEGKPTRELPERLPHRTNLDTGAFYTGRLSIGVFETDRPGGAVDIIQISRLALSSPGCSAHQASTSPCSAAGTR